MVANIGYVMRRQDHMAGTWSRPSWRAPTCDPSGWWRGQGLPSCAAAPGSGSPCGVPLSAPLASHFPFCFRRMWGAGMGGGGPGEELESDHLAGMGSLSMLS